jgi:hypothetical protein
LLFLAALALQTTAPTVFGQAATTAAAPAAFEPPVVPVHEEPHHRQVFQYGHTRILDLRVPPNDGTWFHIHAWPVLYVTFSGTRMRTETLGEENGGAGGAAGTAARGGAPRAGAAPGGQGGAPRGGAGPGGRGGPAASGAAAAAQPAGPRATSTTSYFEHPITHRIDNVGTSLLQAMVVINETAGDDTVSSEAAGFDGMPELTNKWFRSYRHTLQPGEVSAEHRHEAPVVIIQATSGKGLAEGPMKFELNEKSQWAFFDAGVAHTLRNLGNTPLELLEIEVRQPR